MMIIIIIHELATHKSIIEADPHSKFESLPRQYLFRMKHYRKVKWFKWIQLMVI